MLTERERNEVVAAVAAMTPEAAQAAAEAERSTVMPAVADIAATGLAGSSVDAVLLVGDLKYYEPLGFAPVPPGQIRLPGPVRDDDAQPGLDSRFR